MQRMKGKKNLIYRNSLGQEIVFDNSTLFLEGIDMTGTAGIHTVESLAMTDGQTTIRHQLGAKTIPCSFAVKCVGNVEWLKRRLEQVFTPKLEGVLTVITPYLRYEIDCYPQNVPTFKMAENDCVYRFDVDFTADYPYWRVGDKKEYTFPANGGVYIVSDCPFDLPVVVTFPENTGTSVYRNGNHGIYLSSATHPPLRIHTQNFEVYTSVSNFGPWTKGGTRYLSPFEDLTKIEIKYGSNVFWSQEGVTMSYYELSLGEV